MCVRKREEEAGRSKGTKKYEMNITSTTSVALGKQEEVLNIDVFETYKVLFLNAISLCFSYVC